MKVCNICLLSDDPLMHNLDKIAHPEKKITENTAKRKTLLQKSILGQYLFR